jgi:hypothetical protein
MNKEYIGDGVYVEFDGFAFVLTTERHENGVSRTETIVLEPDVFDALTRYVIKSSNEGKPE